MKPGPSASAAWRKRFWSRSDQITLQNKNRIVKIYTLTDFGTFTLTEVIMCTSSDNLPHIKETIANEKRLSKVGYDCTERKTIKAKI